MNKTLVFCEECRKDVNYIISETTMSGSLKGTSYQYTGREARCMDCGALVYVPEVNDTNPKALYDAYRQSNNIIPLKTIRAIPEKYSIGKRPLSLMLGWGEQTFSRYYDGDIPSKQYSDILARIYTDPSYYAEILEHGKANLKSPSAYEKSKNVLAPSDRIISRDSIGEYFTAVKEKYNIVTPKDIRAYAWDMFQSL